MSSIGGADWLSGFQRAAASPILAIPGVIGGVLFCSNLCDPPLIDLSNYEFKQY